MRDIVDIGNVKRRFLAHLTLEKGMSANTAQAYSDDVDKLIHFLTDSGVGVERATPDDLERFVCTLQDVGIQPRSQARIISGVKCFINSWDWRGIWIRIPPTCCSRPR